MSPFLTYSCKTLPRVITMLMLLLPLRSITACPFCGAVAPTLADNIAEAETAVIAVVVPGQVAPETLSLGAVCQLQVKTVLKGKIELDQVIETPLVEDLSPNTHYLAISLPHSEGQIQIVPVWSYSVKLSPESTDYVRRLAKFPSTSPDRLKFYQSFLRSDELLITKDAHGELAKAPYAELQQASSSFDRQWLLERLDDPETPADRQRLYWMLLSTCGKSDDAKLFDKSLARRETDPEFELGLDAAMACYVSLGGVRAIERLERDYFLNQPDAETLEDDSLQADAVAAVSALRFHLNEKTGLSRERIQQSMRLILKNRSLGDLVIPDLARLEDWTVVDSVYELFKAAATNDALTKTLVVNYLRVCPLPQAKAYLEQCRKSDPAAVRRSEMLYRLNDTSR